MSQIITYGLLRDNNLSDVRNPQAGLTHLLTQLVGKRYTSEDVEFINNLSIRSDLKERLLKIADIVVNNPDTFLPARPLITFKNRIDRYKLDTGEPNFYGGNGLVCRYYSWNAIYPNDTALGTPFDSAVFNNKTPLYTEVFWERGNIDYGDSKIQNINNPIGIISHTGLFKPTTTGEHIFRITNISTGDVIIELTDMDGNDLIVTNNRYAPGTTIDIKTKILEKFTFYKIKIFWFKSPELAALEDSNIIDIKIRPPYTDSFTGLYRGYLYDENYNEKNIGKLGEFYKNKLPLGGTNFFDKKNNGIENYSFGGRLSADYRALLTRGRLLVNYKPPKNYNDVVSTSYNNNLSADSIIIKDISNVSNNIRVGNLVLSESKTIPPFTYVKEIINDTTIHLNKPLSQNISNDTLYFIEQNGLKGYILNYTPNESLSSFDGLTELYGDERGIAPGDVVISDNTAGYTTISSIIDNTSISLNKSVSSNGHTNFVLFYYKGGLQNVSLKGYCTGVDNLSVLNGINTNFVDVNSTTININSLLDYNGQAVSLSQLTTADPSVSAFRVDYNNSIQNNTYVTSVNELNGDITISNPTIDKIPAGTSILFTLSTPSNPATDVPRYTCFAPGDITAPFIATETGIKTPQLSSIDIGYNTLEFKRLSLIDSTNTSVNTITGPISYNSKLRVEDKNNKLLDLFLVSN